MQRCLDLAQCGLGHVAPNPMVGAVIVHNDKIIGEGFHQRFGGPHAEVMAIEDALKNHSEEILQDSELYVSLEPCSHTGKTAPCTNLILRYKFRHVIIACEDPFEKVRGNGIKILREAGIQVTTNIMEKEAMYLNRRFITFHTLKRPYVILKFAQSKDNFIAPAVANENQRWITNIYSRKLVHRWRSEEQAIIVGTNTARTDNPALTLRDWPGNQPLRIVLDKELNLPQHLKVLDASVPTIIFNGLKDDIKLNNEFIRLDFSKSVVSQICMHLYNRSVQSVIVEGGRVLLQSFIDEKLWDESRIFTGAKTLCEGLPAPQFSGKLISKHKLEEDLLEIYKPKSPTI